MHPSRLLHVVSTIEACTWAFLIVAMLTKYVWAPELGDVLVAFAGAAHGTAFLLYLFVSTVVGVNARWRWWMFFLAWASSVPPFFTLLFDWFAHRRDLVSASWFAPEVEREHGELHPRLAGVVRWTMSRPITQAATAIAAFLFILTPSLAN
ncbi:DUF3817 domain-containing protein [Gulosibacter molinativorax]|uniref:DUF3817 domain-containing protein n=1 Tax=Gulosibacter molinativorax TaxID=256821 RepID=A0ABT7C865_9MICO|nr:DUF3817 domain-containing protein [Gulosibacter molinativorax]MDJ1371411.1 DUF3817 domain-containing protein [Gulosibacter molinativorax]QUY62909.1 Hypotetical protein [Gulosibacter molinativorax]